MSGAIGGLIVSVGLRVLHPDDLTLRQYIGLALVMFGLMEAVDALLISRIRKHME